MRVGLMADTHDRIPVIAEFVRLMQEAGYGPFNKLTLTYLTPGNPDGKRLAAVFQAMARHDADVAIRPTASSGCLALWS